MDQKKEPSTTLIYVSNLPFNTTDEQFKDLFKGFGVKTAYIAKRKNGRSKGFGFVNLEKDSDQKAAIENVNGKELESRKLIARIAYNDERRNEQGELREEFKTQTNTQTVASETVVYVSNLAWTVNDEELKKLFAEFNPKVATVATRRNGKSKGFGFVEFNNKEDREKALSMDQKNVSDRPITVKQSTGYRGENATETQPRRRNDNRDRRDNRDSRDRRDNRDNRDNRDRRDNRDNRRSSPRRNVTRRSKSPTKRSPSGNNSTNNNNNDRRTERTERRNEFTLYIKNLPFELDETDLKDVFSEFNPKSANIPRSYNQRSKGFGFVEFSNSKDQTEALKALDQSEINGRVVAISVSNPSSRRSPRRSPRRNRSSRSPRRSPRRNRSPRNNRSPRRNRSPRNNNRSPRNNNRENRKSNTSSEPSKTNIYVSNIPFSLDENKLGEYFKDFKVNKLTIPRKRNGNSFGYAFIEFASNEDQQKALKLNDTTIDGRKIVVNAAYQRDQNQTQSK